MDFWDRTAFLGYMVEEYEKERGNDIFGRPLNNDDDDDNSQDNNTNNWF